MGRPLIYSKKLVKKIADKTGKSSKLVVKSISAFAFRKKISPEVALIITADKYKIGTATFMRGLNPNQQAQLSLELNSQSKDKIIGESKTSRKVIHPVQIPKNDFSDPFLGGSVYKNIPSEGYSIMFVLENSIRTFITKILLGVYGGNWWLEVRNKKSLKETVRKVDSRKASDSDNWYHSKRGAHEIYYTDYLELVSIIRVFDKEFCKLFKKGAQKNLIGKLEELGPTRNVIAHNNPITPKDLERLKVHARDWFSYMQYLYTQNT